MLSKEQKIKLIRDIKKGKISNQIIQYMNSMVVWSQPAKCAINDVQFAKNVYENTINYLRLLNIQIIEYVNVSKQIPKKLIEIEMLIKDDLPKNIKFSE